MLKFFFLARFVKYYLVCYVGAEGKLSVGGNSLNRTVIR